MTGHGGWLTTLERAQAWLIGLVVLLALAVRLAPLPPWWAVVLHDVLVVALGLLVASLVVIVGARAWGVLRRRGGRVQA